MNIETAIWYKYDKATGINFVLVQRVFYGEHGTIEGIIDSTCLVDGITPYVPLGECTVLDLKINPLEYFESIEAPRPTDHVKNRKVTFSGVSLQ